MRHIDLIGFSSVRVAPGEAWIGKLPDEPGLYAAVLGRAFPRLAGETDILRVGQSGKTIAIPDGSTRRATLRGRWRRYWQFPVLSDHDIRDVLRILIERGEPVEVAYLACAEPLEVLLERERELLRRFFADHLELPPLNRQKP